MESGIIPAIISFILPGIGQALTDGKPTGKWIVVFIAMIIVFLLLNMLIGAKNFKFFLFYFFFF